MKRTLFFASDCVILPSAWRELIPEVSQRRSAIVLFVLLYRMMPGLVYLPWILCRIYFTNRFAIRFILRRIRFVRKRREEREV